MISEEIKLTLNSPITEEQWDAINDYDFDHTEEIEFHTKHGKTVRFKKENEGQADARKLDEWCTDCKEYDKEHHNCPRFNRVIREALKEVKGERLK